MKRAMSCIVLLVIALPLQIAAQSVYIDSPSTPGEIWPSGLPAEIKWHMIGNYTAVKIEVSVDDKATWQTLVDCYPDVGVWTWDVPAGIESDRCFVRLFGKYITSCKYDHAVVTLPEPFVITAPPEVTVRPIDIAEAVSGECFDVTIDVVNPGDYELDLWFDVDMYDGIFNIVNDTDNDLPFILPPRGSATVTRAFRIPYGFYPGAWNVKVMLWGMRDGDRFAGPRLYDSGWMHPVTVDAEKATWGAVKAAAESGG